ncbi:hypothetical protein ACFL4Z_00615 [candidate division KSB1 bacterium]
MSSGLLQRHIPLTANHDGRGGYCLYQPALHHTVSAVCRAGHPQEPATKYRQLPP